MSLNLDKFSQYVVAGEKIDYLEIRLGEAYVIPFDIKNSSGTVTDISNWTFQVTSQVYTAVFQYSGDTLSSISSISVQSDPQQVTGLEVRDIDAAAGTAKLVIPAGVNPNPSTLVTPAGTNAMLNILTITATYPSSVANFNNIRKLLIGLIVKFGG
jgi:hypothetical protein